MSKAVNYFASQGRLVKPELGRRVVEVGCGIGNFTGMLLDREAVVSIDIEPECIARLKQRYPNQSNLQTFVCDAGGPALADFAAFRPDTCVCLNALEHIAEEGAALKGMASILRPRGVIVLLLPAFQALYGPIDRNLSHYRRYSRESILALATAARLRTKKIHYVNLAGFFGWWINSHIFRREDQSEAQIRIFDRYLVPYLSQIESWIKPPFGQSLFVVLEKP
jgi:SAM-dependent methyltransferase